MCNPRYFYVQPKDFHRLGRRPESLKFYYHFLHLTGVQQEVVFVTFTGSLYSEFCPLLKHSTMAVSSECFWMWQDSEWYLKSAVHDVKGDRARTVPCVAPVLLINVPETQFSNLTVVFLSGSL